MEDPFDSIISEDDDLSSTDTVFRDMTMLALSGFVIIVLLLLPWLNVIDNIKVGSKLRGDKIDNNILDVIILISYILDFDNLDYQELVIADVNGDSSLDVLDVVNLVNLILN